MTIADKSNRIIHGIRALADPDILGQLRFGPAAVIGARITELIVHGNELSESDIVLRVIDEFGLRRPVPPGDLLN